MSNIMGTRRFIKTGGTLAVAGLAMLGASLALNAVVAWTTPAAAPPTDAISGFGNWTLTGSNLYFNQTANAKFYTDSKKGIQIRIDSDDATDGINDASTFSLNNGSNTEVFKVDEAGLVTVISRITGIVTPTGSSDAATKGYVDAAVSAAGGGDATLDNQVAIMGSGYASTTDSLRAISVKIGNIPVGGDATYNKQLEIQQDVQRTFGWVTPNSTYVSVGGNTAFCRSNAVSAAGIVTMTPINNGLVCDTNRECSGGACITIAPLTYSGTTHTEVQCTTAGGTVFNTGTGTICKFSGASCPSGWSQAANWQRYSSVGWGATVDGCGCSVGDSGPTTFADQQAVNKERGSAAGTTGTGSGGNICWISWYFKDPSGGGGSCTAPEQLVYNYTFSTSYNPSTNRVEIGCK